MKIIRENGQLYKVITPEDRLNKWLDKTLPLPKSELSNQKDNKKVVTTKRSTGDPKLGFRSLGEFSLAVQKASLQGSEQKIHTERLHERLTAATTFGNEVVGEDGGFAFPPEWASDISVRVAEESLFSLCDTVQVGTGNYSSPVDDDPPWSSGGVSARWENEAATLIQDKPKLELTEQSLKKLIGLIPISEELLEDSPMLDAYLKRKMTSVMMYEINFAILQGTGVGQPLGITNAPATIVIEKQSGQTAETVLEENLIRMYSVLTASARQNSVWVCHPDVQNQTLLIDKRIMGDDGKILGKRVIVSEACQALGTKGDIFLANFQEYLIAHRRPKQQWSMHLWFDQHISAFKIVMRLDGHPWLSAPITSRVGGNTRSPFVTLAERA